MSEVDDKETVDNEEVEQSPSEELVDMILAGELHAANEKFNSIVEAKVIEKIEEDKHKISQTLFAEDDDEEGDEKENPNEIAWRELRSVCVCVRVGRDGLKSLPRRLTP